MVTLTIDGKQIQVAQGTTILEAATELGIKIPTLCWLKKVSTTGACRICVVKIEGIDRFMTACNTPVKEGIIVTTSSPQLAAARKKTMELMLVNHPLDCPICDAAGECDLQDSCYALGVDTKRFNADLERLPIKYDWKLLENDPNRCILCEKCVKVCREIVGCEAIDIVNRGDRSLIDTITGKPLDCEFCGNCINACPTGTLISKPFKFVGRPWDFEVTKSICGFCASGCELDYHHRNGRIERVTSSDDYYNHGNLCINGRFGYAAFNSPDRIKNPLIKDNTGKQQISDWEQALASTAKGLKDIIISNSSDAVAGIGSHRVTNEENYLFQKFMRAAIHTNNIDSEARLGYFPSQIIQHKMLGYSGGTYPMDAIENANTVLIIGSDLKAESAGFAYRVIHAANKNDATLLIANSRKTSMNKFANSFLQYHPGSEAWLLAGLNKAIISGATANKAFIEASTKDYDTFKKSLDEISFEQILEQSGVTEAELHEAARFISSGRVAVIYGTEIICSADSQMAVKAVIDLALLTGATGSEGAGIYPIDEKNNTQGMLDMGICPEFLPGYHTYEHAAEQFTKAWGCQLPMAPGKSIFQIIDAIEKGEIKALYVVGSNLLHTLPNRARTLEALKKLDLLIVQDNFMTETAELAHIVLPAAISAEKSGSFTTVDNRVNCFTKAVNPAGESRTDFDILSALYNMFPAVKQDKTLSIEELRSEISQLSKLYDAKFDQAGRSKSRVDFKGEQAASFVPLKPAATANDSAYPFKLTVSTILHHNGTFSTWSDNNTSVSGTPYIAISAEDANNLEIKDGQLVKISTYIGSTTLTSRITECLSAGVLFAPSNFRRTCLNSLTQAPAYNLNVKLEKV